MPTGVGSNKISNESANSTGSTHAAHCDSDEMSSGCSLPLTHRHLLAEALDDVRDDANDEDAPPSRRTVWISSGTDAGW